MHDSTFVLIYFCNSVQGILIKLALVVLIIFIMSIILMSFFFIGIYKLSVELIIHEPAKQ